MLFYIGEVPKVEGAHKDEQMWFRNSLKAAFDGAMKIKETPEQIERSSDFYGRLKRWIDCWSRDARNGVVLCDPVSMRCDPERTLRMLAGFKEQGIAAYELVGNSIKQYNIPAPAYEKMNRLTDEHASSVVFATRHVWNPEIAETVNLMSKSFPNKLYFETKVFGNFSNINEYTTDEEIDLISKRLTYHMTHNDWIDLSKTTILIDPMETSVLSASLSMRLINKGAVLIRPERDAEEHVKGFKQISLFCKQERTVDIQTQHDEENASQEQDDCIHPDEER